MAFCCNLFGIHANQETNLISILNYKGKLRFTQVRIREHVQIHIISYRGESDLTVKQATVLRFQEIMAQRNIRPNELANLSGVTPSTVYSMLDERRKELSISTIKKLCDGLEITLGEFFSTPLFDNLEQEIKLKFGIKKPLFSFVTL